MAGPKNITRAIIDATVDRGIREIAEDPQRSVRKLADMGKQFINGRFLQEVYCVIQELLRDDECPYYAAIEHLLRYTDRKQIKQFGINIGYNSLTYGGKIIRTKEPDSVHLIPWILMMRINPRINGSLTPLEVSSLIEQGQKIGIYSYFIHYNGSLTSLPSMLEIFEKYKNCAFLCTLPDEELTPNHLTAVKRCSNTLLLFSASGSCTPGNVQNFHRQKSLYSIYSTYNDDTCTGWIDGSSMKACIPYESAFLVLIAEDETDPENCKKVSQAVKSSRVGATYPFISFDLYSDAVQIDRIMSSNSCFMEILENGDLKTPDALISDFRHTTSLEQLLSVALPKNQ